MEDHIDLKGASGQIYRYRVAPDADPRTTASGNFAYTAPADGGVTVLYLGEANNLLDARQRWAEAQELGASQLFVRLNVSAAARRGERDDLVEELRPPMNRADVA